MDKAVAMEVPKTEPSAETPVITFNISLERLRLLGTKVNRDRVFGHKEAQAFLTLYAADIEADLVATVQNFLSKKLAPPFNAAANF